MPQPDRIPLLVLSDDPKLPTGLGRIARDLLAALLKFPELEIAALGCGADEDRRDGYYPVFRMLPLEASCGEMDMPRMEKVFFKGRKPILFPTWDATRSLWIKRKDILWLNTPVAWGYFPFDSYGPNKMQPRCVQDVLRRFEHIAVPSIFAGHSLEGIEVDIIPHGYDPKVFFPRDPAAGRKLLKVADSVKHIVGVVATNQARKDWGMIAEVCGGLARQRENIHFWWHTDSLDRCWNFALLIHEFGLARKVTITYNAPDEQMAEMYSACSLTLAPGLGEGFGYPILESIACGTPVVHGTYGAGMEIVCHGGGRVIPVDAFRWEPTSFPVQRPVYSAEEWIRVADDLLHMKTNLSPERIAETVSTYKWENLSAKWEAWIARGIEKYKNACLHLGASASA